MTNTAYIADSIRQMLQGTLNKKNRRVSQSYEEQEDVHCIFVHRNTDNPDLDGHILFVVMVDNEGDISVDRWRKTSTTDDIAIDTLLASR